MSHFTRIKTKMVEKEYIISALEDLGHPYDASGDSPVKGYANRVTQAEIKVTTKNPGYDIGFVKSDEGYEIVADWYGIRGTTQKQFVEQLTQRYAYHTTRAKLQEQGFTLVNEESETDGRIHLVVRRMA